MELHRPLNRKGYTLPELMIGLAIMGILVAAFGLFLKQVSKATVTIAAQGHAQDKTRRALAKLEEELIHANEVRTASGTFVEFVVDIDRTPLYDPDGDLDGDGIVNRLDADRDDDASDLLAAANQWRAGFNLEDDDENGDAQIDARRRIWLSNGTLWLDEVADGGAWGGAGLVALVNNVSTFTLTYFGNKANNLGKNIDSDANGVITAAEMDSVLPAAGMGNNNGGLDLANERRYITSVRARLGLDENKDGKLDYAVESEVYPPLLPLKSQ